MKRRLLAGLLLAVLATSAGCAALGPGSVDESQLSRAISYDWDVDATATITIERGRYEAVYRIRNRNQFEAYRFQRLNDRSPIDPIGPKFRYPNGTVVNLTSESIVKRGSKTIFDLPAANGTLAYAVQKEGTQIRLPQLVEGSYVIILPPNTDVKYPILSQVVPSGYERLAAGDVVRLRWHDPGGNRITVEYYLLRDLLLLGALLAVGSLLAVSGSLYYWFQIRSLRERREAIDVDVDRDEDGLL